MHYILGTYLYITTYLTVLHDRLKCLLSYKQITLVPYMGTDGNYLYPDFSTISLTTFRIIRRIRLACTTSYIPLQYYISYSAPWLIEVLTLIFTLKSCPISSKMSSSNRTCLFQECKWDRDRPTFVLRLEKVMNLPQAKQRRENCHMTTENEMCCNIWEEPKYHTLGRSFMYV